MCLMEYVAYLAGEPWSDRPDCTHPVLAALARAVNDQLPDKERQGLARLADRLIGTAPRGSDLQRQILSVRLAVWCARWTACRARPEERAVCEAAIVAAEAWADEPGPRAADAAYAAYLDAVYHAAMDTAATNAIKAAQAAVSAACPARVGQAVSAAEVAAAYAAADADEAAGTLAGVLEGLLDEHDRLTGAAEALKAS
jgi:hypothetical protein